MEDRCIEVNDVSLFYAGSTKPILDRIHLNIKKGCIYGLLGPSGCGKTSILKVYRTFKAYSTHHFYLDHPGFNQADIWLSDCPEQLEHSWTWCWAHATK